MIEPDGKPPMFEKSCSLVLARLLYLIFKKSLSMGYFPNIWKRSFVTPEHKSRDNHNVTNYISISKMSLISKMSEALITKKLSLVMSPFICKNQHGFRPKMSISTNILFYKTKILSTLNERIQLDTI